MASSRFPDALGAPSAQPMTMNRLRVIVNAPADRDWNSNRPHDRLNEPTNQLGSRHRVDAGPNRCFLTDRGIFLPIMSRWPSPLYRS
jgi:hypothetical protein